GVSSGPAAGLEDIRKAVANVGKGGDTAVVLDKGVVRFAKDYLDEGLCLVLHLSASAAISTHVDRKVLVTQVDEAISYGADAISVHVNLGGEDDDRMIEDLGTTATACDRFGFPLLAMMYPRGPKIKNPYDVDVVKHVARVGAELGADIVKTLYTRAPETFKEVVRGCPVPVVVAGGPKLDSDRAAFEMVEGALSGGAVGVSMGRNIFQAKDAISVRGLKGVTNHVVVRTEDWKIIPLENLIAHFQGSETRLLVEVRDAAEAKLVFEAMEVGVHGILLVPSSPNEIRAVRGL